MKTYELINLSVLLVKILPAFLLLMIGKSIHRYAKWIALSASLASLGLFIIYIPALQQGLNTPLNLDYLPSMGIQLSLKIDWLSFPFLLTEEFVTIFAMIYAIGYIKSDDRNYIFYALLLLFSAGMSGTTLANDIFLFYFFWELMLIASALLVVYWGESAKKTAVALKYFIITHLGSLLVLVAFIMTYSQSGTDLFSALCDGVQMYPETIP